MLSMVGAYQEPNATMQGFPRHGSSNGQQRSAALVLSLGRIPGRMSASRRTAESKRARAATRKHGSVAFQMHIHWNPRQRPPVFLFDSFVPHSIVEWRPGARDTDPVRRSSSGGTRGPILFCFAARQRFLRIPICAVQPLLNLHRPRSGIDLSAAFKNVTGYQTNLTIARL